MLTRLVALLFILTGVAMGLAYVIPIHVLTGVMIHACEFAVICDYR
jgi:hypothetical protein